MINTVSKLRLSREENELYTRLFIECDDKGCGLASGNVAGNLFQSSGLPSDILYIFWGIGDPNDTGELDYYGFCICCRLIAHVQCNGIDYITNGNNLTLDIIEELKLYLIIPDSLPKFDISINNKSDNYNIIIPSYNITQDDINKYKYQFDCLDVNINGYIDGNCAKNYYLDLGYFSQDYLMKLWNLSDLDCDGKLSFKEFCIMQKLISICKEYNLTPPINLPLELQKFNDGRNGDGGSDHRLMMSNDDNGVLSHNNAVMMSNDNNGVLSHNNNAVVSNNFQLMNGGNKSFKFTSSDLMKLSSQDLLYLSELLIKRMKETSLYNNESLMSLKGECIQLEKN